MPLGVRSFSLPLGMPLGMRVELLRPVVKERIDSIDDFIRSTRDVLYLRREDRLLIIRPNKIQHVNDTAYEMLDLLYGKNRTVNETVTILSEKYEKSADILLSDIITLVQNIRGIMQDNYGGLSMVEEIPFNPQTILFPVLSEIALTYRCQNRCDFCYASSPYRGNEMAEMTTEEVRTVIKIIHRDAHVPTISFTGGEPTLRDDLPELVHYAHSLGMRTNLITNGIRCADMYFVGELARAGLKSAQVSLESHDESLHNEITGNSNAFRDCVQGIINLKSSGIHTHTNTTICRKNSSHLMPLARFVREEFNADYLSMNMIIATGIARDNDNTGIGYSGIENILKPLLDYCEILGIRFVWYSPTPYCVFNPLDHGLGSKSCACVSGLLSVNPAGEVLPCSSFDRGIGNLLTQNFQKIWNSDQALYWREKRYVPPACRGCDLEKLCGGGCPLYWEHAGSFHEIEMKQNRSPKIKNLLWRLEKQARVKSKGIQGILNPGRQ
jgi:radical SAM protein with 4Fe4S-binding SPASM domain